MHWPELKVKPKGVHTPPSDSTTITCFSSLWLPKEPQNVSQMGRQVALVCCLRHTYAPLMKCTCGEAYGTVAYTPSITVCACDVGEILRVALTLWLSKYPRAPVGMHAVCVCVCVCVCVWLLWLLWLCVCVWW